MIGKLAIFFALCLTFFRVSASAQTTVTTTGGTTSTVPLFTGSASIGSSNITQSGNNVGIGGTNPAFPLDVSGIIRTGTATIIGDNSSSNGMHITNDGNATGLRFWSGVYGYGTPRMQISNNGFIGIGTLSPTTIFHVSGDSSFVPYGDVGQLIVGGGATNFNKGVSIGYDTTNNFGWIYSRIQAVSPSNLVLQGAGGNVGIGTNTPGAKFELNGSMKLTAGSGASITYPDSTVQSTAWNGTTFGGDYAESVDLSGPREDFEPGDVLIVDPDNPGKFLKSSFPYSTLVAGIYSTKPGLVGRRVSADPKANSTAIPMAMVGIVPTKVTAENGPIKAGDILVASSVPGRAMKGTNRSLLSGAIVGKALGKLETGTGVIEVLISLQ